MCYQYPFAVLPVVVPTPESHRSVSIPLGTLSSPQAVYRSLPCKHESSFIPLRLLFPQNLRFCGSPVVGHGILRRGIISPPDGYSVVKVQVPLTCMEWGGCFGGVFFKKVFISPLVRTGETVLVMLFLKDLYFFDPLTCSHWEGHFGGCYAKKFLPSLVPTGNPVLVGCFAKIFIPPPVPTENPVLVR